jgi:hypothetical protein
MTSSKKAKMLKAARLAVALGVVTTVEGQGRTRVERFAADAVVEQVSASAANQAFPGYTTYRCSMQLMGDATNLYTVFGTAAHPMYIPQAFQTPLPFGVHVGGVNPAFLSVPACGVGHQADGGNGHACGHDSWLTVGLTDGNDKDLISHIGIDWASWTEEQGLTVDNGAIFWMNPDDGPTPTDTDGPGPGSVAGNIVVAQITLPEAHEATLTLSAQGRTDGESPSRESLQTPSVGVGTGNWEEVDIVFEMPPGVHAPVDCQGDWGDYTACSASCGGGTKARSYTVTQNMAHGGQACPSDSPQSQHCNTAACRPQVESERNAVTPIVTQIVTSPGNPDLPAHTTYVCSLKLKGDAINLHTIYGSKTSPMLIPAAYQTPTPFGVDTGGVRDSFFALPACGIGVSDTGEQGRGCQRDSWLTVGITRGNDGNFLGDVGIDWESWTSLAGATVDEGAVFWLSKDDGPSPNDVNGKVTLKGEGSAGLKGEDSAPLHRCV